MCTARLRVIRMAVAIPVLISGAAAMAQAATAPAATSAPAAAPAARSTTDQVLDSAGRMVERPFRDLNVVRDPIPPALLAVMAEPFSLEGLRNCRDYAAEIARLTAVLGPDVDSKQAVDASETPAEFALGAAESVAGSLIPGSGLIRRLSGADAAQRRVQAAVFAGSLRRAFLKGRAGGKGCRV